MKSMTVTDHESANRSQRFRKGPHHEIGLVLEPEMFHGSASVLAQHADPVRVIDHQAGVELLLELDDPREIRKITLHREDAINDDHP